MFCATLLALALSADPKPRLDTDGIPLPTEALRRLGSARFCTDLPRAMAFSTDGKTVYSVAAGYRYSGDSRPDVTAWDVATGQRVWAFTGERFFPRVIATDPDGKTLWLAGRDSWSNPQRTTAIRVKLDAATGKEVDRKQLGKSWSEALDLRADGTLVWNRLDEKEQDLTVRLLKPDGTDVLAWDPEGQMVGLLKLSPDGKALYVGGRAFEGPGWKLSAVDMATGKAKWSVDTSMQDTLAVSPDGKVVAMAVSGDPPPKALPSDPERASHKTTRVVGRYASNGEEYGAVFVGDEYFQSFITNDPRTGRPLRFTPDGKQLLTMTDKRKTVTIHTEGWEADAKLRDDQAVRGWSTPDGKSYFVSDGGYNLRQFDAATHAEIAPVPLVIPLRYWYSDGPGIQFSPDSKQLLFGKDTSPRITWDVATGQELERLPRGERAKGPKSGVAGISWEPDRTLHSPDGKLLLRRFHSRNAAGWNKAEVVNAKTDEQTAELSIPDYNTFAFSPDSKRILGIGRRATLGVWDTATGGAPIAEVNVYLEETSKHVRIHPTENWFALAEKQRVGEGIRDLKWQVNRYDFDPLKRVKSWDVPGAVVDFTLAHDGRMIGWAGGPELRTREILSVFVIDPTKDEAFAFKLPENAQACALSADRRSVAVSAARGDIHLYELSTGQRRHTFTGLTRGAGELAFSPDGKTLASTSADGPVLLWDVKGELTKPAKPDAAGWDAAWKALTGDDAEKAFAAVRLIAAYPDDGAAELAKRFAEVKSPMVVSAERAVEALRLADTESARKQITEWAKGPEKHPLTVAAKRK